MVACQYNSVATDPTWCALCFHDVHHDAPLPEKRIELSVAHGLTTMFPFTVLLACLVVCLVLLSIAAFSHYWLIWPWLSHLSGIVMDHGDLLRDCRHMLRPRRHRFLTVILRRCLRRPRRRRTCRQHRSDLTTWQRRSLSWPPRITVRSTLLTYAR